MISHTETPHALADRFGSKALIASRFGHVCSTAANRLSDKSWAWSMKRT